MIWRTVKAMGDIQYCDENGDLHREDGPAFIMADGTEIWFINGKIHREDGPSEVSSDGTERWIQNNDYHRDDGGPVLISVFDSGEYGLFWVAGSVESAEGSGTFINTLKNYGASEEETKYWYTKHFKSLAPQDGQIHFLSPDTIDLLHPHA